MAETEIDAGAVLDERDRRRGAERGDEAADVEGARGRAALGGERRTWPVGARTFLLAMGLVAAGIVVVLLLKARSVHAEDQARRETRATERVEKHVPSLKLAAPAPAEPARRSRGPIAVGGTESPEPSQAASADSELVQRRLARGFGPGDGESATTPSAPAPSSSTAPTSPTEGAGNARRASGALEEKLEAVELKASRAALLPDRDFLLTQGAMIDCVLETKLVSTVAGMTSCHLTRDVYSTNGRVVLLDRGSRVIGRYQGGLQQGDARIFVVWTRVETPSGVVVDLQSPGTGALGEGGVGGWMDTHFWDRFGAAILLSVIGDASDAAAARLAGPSQGTNITFASTANAGKEVVAKSLEPSINIPPTLYKNQGERVGIFVARDLDFRSVYGLERAGAGTR